MSMMNAPQHSQINAPQHSQSPVSEKRESTHSSVLSLIAFPTGVTVGLALLVIGFTAFHKFFVHLLGILVLVALGVAACGILLWLALLLFFSLSYLYFSLPEGVQKALRAILGSLLPLLVIWALHWIFDQIGPAGGIEVILLICVAYGIVVRFPKRRKESRWIFSAAVSAVLSLVVAPLIAWKTGLYGNVVRLLGACLVFMCAYWAFSEALGVIPKVARRASGLLAVWARRLCEHWKTWSEALGVIPKSGRRASGLLAVWVMGIREHWRTWVEATAPDRASRRACRAVYAKRRESKLAEVTSFVIETCAVRLVDRPLAAHLEYGLGRLLGNTLGRFAAGFTLSLAIGFPLDLALGLIHLGPGIAPAIIGALAAAAFAAGGGGPPPAVRALVLGALLGWLAGKAAEQAVSQITNGPAAHWLGQSAGWVLAAFLGWLAGKFVEELFVRGWTPAFPARPPSSSRLASTPAGSGWRLASTPARPGPSRRRGRTARPARGNHTRRKGTRARH